MEKNGEIFVVENGKMYGLSHKVLCQKKAIMLPTGIEFGDTSFHKFGIIQKEKKVVTRSTGIMKYVKTEHMFLLSYSKKWLWIFSHLQKTLVNTTNVSAPLKCLVENLIKHGTSNDFNIQFCSSSPGGIILVLLLADDLVNDIHPVITYIASEKLFAEKSTKNVISVKDFVPTTVCHMLLNLEEKLIDCQLHSNAGYILCLSSERITIFHLTTGTVLNDIAAPHQGIDWVNILPYGKSEYAIIHMSKKVEIRSVSDNARPVYYYIKGVAEIHSVTCYGSSIIVAGEDESVDKSSSIHIFTPLSEAEKFCAAIEHLYNSVGYSFGKTYKPSNCLKTSFDNSSKLSNGAMKVLNSFKDDRSRIFDGTLLSSGAIGFITESTLKCLQKTVNYVTQAKSMFLSAQNSKNARIDCLINELYAEGFFGSIASSQTGEASDLHDYIYSKRKIEVNSILKNSSKPFKFQPNKNKMYAALNQSDVQAWDALQILRTASFQPVIVDGPSEPKATEASRKFMENLHQRTKGQRCRAPRSNHKKIAMTAPYQIYDANNKAKRKKNNEVEEGKL